MPQQQPLALLAWSDAFLLEKDKSRTLAQNSLAINYEWHQSFRVRVPHGGK